MATYLAHDALRLPAASLLANSGMCVNIEIKIWLLLGVNVDTAFSKTVYVCERNSTRTCANANMFRIENHALRLKLVKTDSGIMGSFCLLAV